MEEEQGAKEEEVEEVEEVEEGEVGLVIGKSSIEPTLIQIMMHR